MAVLEFDGVDDEMLFTGTLGPLNKTQGVTVVLVARSLSNPTAGTAECLFSMGSSADGGVEISLYQDQTNQFQWGGTDPNADAPANVGTIGTGWSVFALRKAASTSAPVLSRGAIGGALTHTTSGTSVAVSAGNNADRLMFGDFLNNGGQRDMRIAVAAVYSSVLTAGQIDGISTAATTVSMNALSPIEIIEFTSSNPTCLKSLLTKSTTVGTTVINGDDPSWTFGLGLPPVNTGYGLGSYGSGTYGVRAAAASPTNFPEIPIVVPNMAVTRSFTR